MLPFEPIEHGEGMVTSAEAPVSLGRYLGASFGQGVNDNIFNSVYRWSEFHTENLWNMAQGGKVISKEEAQERFGLPTLTFKESIYESTARLLHDRKQKELDRQNLMADVPLFSKRGAAGFVAMMGGNFSNPLDLAALFIPVTGSSKMMAISQKAGQGPIRQAIARGLVTDESIARVFPKAPLLSRTVIQGVGEQAIAEIPLMYSNLQDQANYGPDDSLVNIGFGGLFAGGLHLTLGKLLKKAGDIYNRLPEETKAKVERSFLNDKLEGRDGRAQDIITLDTRLIEEDVKFDYTTAKAKAIQLADEQIDGITAWARAQMEVDGIVGRVNEQNLVRIANEQINSAKMFGKENDPKFKIASQILKNVLGGQRDVTTLQNLARLFSMEFDPLESRFPAAFWRGEPTAKMKAVSKVTEVDRTWETDHTGVYIGGKDVITGEVPVKNTLEWFLPESSKLEKRKQASIIARQSEAELSRLIDEEHARRVKEFIEQEKLRPRQRAAEIQSRIQAAQTISQEKIDLHTGPEKAQLEAILKENEELMKQLEPDKAFVAGKKAEGTEEAPPIEQAIDAAAQCILKGGA